MAITVLPDPNLPYEQMNRESIMNAMQIFLGMMEAKRKKRDTASEIEYRGKTGDAATVNAQANMTSATAGAQFNVAQADKAYQEMRTEEEQNAYLD